MAIPKDIEAEHVHKAIARLRKGELHPFAEPTRYLVHHEGRTYPPKALVGLAAEELTGRPFGPHDFSGGNGPGRANNVLRDLGFDVREITTSSPQWDLQPRKTIRRTELHAQFGGGGQGGISPSAVVPRVFLFTDPSSGNRHGYYDGWGNDGCFYFTGEGQRGDQEMKDGNRAILDHAKDGRSLHLFDGARGTVEYLGEFQVDSEFPYEVRRAPATGGGPIRNVFCFRLVPVDAIEPDPASPRATPRRDRRRERRRRMVGAPERVPIEENRTPASPRAPALDPVEAERREAELVQRFATYMGGLGNDIGAYRISRDPNPAIRTDAFNFTRNYLIEAKAGVEREDVRMALGQLLDYSRDLPDSRLAFLGPARPCPDLEELLSRFEVACIWPDGKRFQDNAGGQLVGQSA